MNNVINTVKDFVDYLQSLDQNKYITGEYLQIMGNQVIDIKSRPLLKDLIEKDIDGNYKLKALIY